MIEITLHGQDRLDAHLEQVPGRLHEGLRAAVLASGKSVKADARSRVIRSHYLPHLPRSIDFRMRRSTRDIVEGSVEAHGTQARLIGVIEHGSPTSGPHPFMGPAGREGMAEFVRRCRTAIRDAFGGA